MLKPRFSFSTEVLQCSNAAFVPPTAVKETNLTYPWLVAAMIDTIRATKAIRRVMKDPRIEQPTCNTPGGVSSGDPLVRALHSLPWNAVGMCSCIHLCRGRRHCLLQRTKPVISTFSAREGRKARRLWRHTSSWVQQCPRDSVRHKGNCIPFRSRARGMCGDGFVGTAPPVLLPGKRGFSHGRAQTPCGPPSLVTTRCGSPTGGRSRIASEG
jgi:hypothetical protein